MYTSLDNLLSLYQWKYSMSEEKEKETQEMVWKIPALDSHSVPQKKIDLCQHAQGKHYF